MTAEPPAAVVVDVDHIVEVDVGHVVVEVDVDHVVGEVDVGLGLAAAAVYAYRQITPAA
jgi:hypothetical protein